MTQLPCVLDLRRPRRPARPPPETMGAQSQSVNQCTATQWTPRFNTSGEGSNCRRFAQDFHSMSAFLKAQPQPSSIPFLSPQDSPIDLHLTSRIGRGLIAGAGGGRNQPAAFYPSQQPFSIPKSEPSPPPEVVRKNPAPRIGRCDRANEVFLRCCLFLIQ